MSYTARTHHDDPTEAYEAAVIRVQDEWERKTANRPDRDWAHDCLYRRCGAFVDRLRSDGLEIAVWWDMTVAEYLLTEWRGDARAELRDAVDNVRWRRLRNLLWNLAKRTVRDHVGHVAMKRACWLLAILATLRDTECVESSTDATRRVI